MPSEYQVDQYKTTFFGGHVRAGDLQSALNTRAREGWRLVRTITDSKRSFLFFAREVHFLIFEREKN